MKTQLLLLLIVIMMANSALGQSSNGFSYQTVIRNAEGQVLSEQQVGLKISLQNENGSSIYYIEEHDVSTSPQGLISLTIGEGDVLQGVFNDIPWSSSEVFIKVEVDPAGGTSYSLLGETQLRSVPFALFAFEGNQGPQGEPGTLVAGTDGQSLVHNGTSWTASSNLYTSSTDNVGIGTTAPEEKLHVAGNILASGSLIGQTMQVGEPVADPDEPLFVVRNSEGLIVFAVYEAGVRIYVDSDEAKLSKGGFAIGGLSPVKTSSEYFRVTPDSVRIYIDNLSTGSKGSKGGFAVGGLSPTKAGTEDYLRITRDSTRIYVNTENKENKGGFAVGGLSPIKGDNSFLYLTPENYFIGHESGQNATGLYNSTLGYTTGKSLTTGTSNIFIGYESGLNNSAGSYNTFLGYQTGKANLASYNTFIGYQVGMNNITGSYNVIMGYLSGSSNTEGSHNVFLGHESGISNTTGWSNNFIGQGAGYSNSEGTNNIFIGNDAGRLNLESSGNIYIGRNAGYNSTEYGNTIVGHTAGEYLETGSNNVIIGSTTSLERTGGSGNLILGAFANNLGGSGDNNTIIGTGAGNQALGSGNVMLGFSAGYFETGSNKLYIHNSSSSSPLVYGDFFKDSLAINGELYVSGMAGGSTAWNTYSDATLKTNILNISNALSLVMQLRGVEYEWQDKSKFDNRQHIGLVAQEVKGIVPQVVNEANGKFTIEYAPLTALLIEAIKEQQTKISLLEKELNSIKGENLELKEYKNKIDEILQRINTIESIQKP